MVKLLSNNQQGGMRKIKIGLIKAKNAAARYVRRQDKRWKRLLFRVFSAVYLVKFLRPVTQPISRLAYAHHRVTAAFMCALIVAGVALPVANDYYREQRYYLNSQAQSLLGEVNPNLTKKLTYDAKEQLYQFNKDAKKTTETAGNPLEKLKSQVGGGGKQDEQLYSVDAPKDLSKGVTYYDNQMQLSFKVTPRVKAMPGEKRSGHLIYPLKGVNGQIAYTSEAGGMKENIILYESPGDTFVTDYKLDLPQSLEARLLDSGDLGIYSADPALFGQISYGSSDDQARVEQARNNSEKTYLAFVIPAPVVMGLGKTNQASVANIKSSFSLKDDTLTVTTTGLDKAEYPLSIDPSINISSSSDFQAGNLEDNNISIENGDLKRRTLSGGGIGGWSAEDNITTARNEHATVVYNGYIYVIGGNGVSNALSDIRYASFGAGGTIGPWQNVSGGLSSARYAHAAIAYNGYLYVLGGYTGSTYLTTVEYTAINSNGSLSGTWQTATSLSSARRDLAAVAYNGYMYVLGGLTSSASTNLVQYAAINANGSLAASWQAAGNNLTSARSEHTAVAYNGYMYVMGGNTGSGYLNASQYAAINSNGTIGTWQSTGNNLTSVRAEHTAVAYNGYMYVMGGNSNGTYVNTVQFAPIYANGTLGAWQTTTPMYTALTEHTAVAYNGYLFVFAGYDRTNPGLVTNVQYAQINSSGATTTAFQNASTTFTTARYGHATVAYNGYIYVTGGHTGSGFLNDVQYAQVTANGVLSSWASTGGTGFTNTRHLHTAVAYNGYLYIIGGVNSGVLNSVQYAAINANGTVSGTWTAGTSTNLTPVYAHTSVAYKGYLYVLGGAANESTFYNTVQYAQLNTNGSINGNWATTTAFTTARAYHASVVSNGYVYVISGSDTANYINDIQYAPLTSNGTIAAGTWQSTTPISGGGRTTHSAAVYNGYLYVIGGSTAGGATNSVVYAPLNSDGSITSGAWLTAGNLTTVRTYLSAVISNGYIYSTGGFYNSTGQSDTQVAEINSGGNGSTGAWTASANNVSNQISNTASAVYNGYIYIIGGNQGAFTNQIRYAPFTKTGDIGAWASTATDGSNNNIPTVGATAGVTDHNATIYKGYMYVLGGWDGTNNRTQTFYAPINSNGTIGTWSSGTALPGGRTSGAAFGYNGYLYLVGGSGNTSTIYTQIQSNGSLGASWLTTSSFGTSRSDLGWSLNNGYIYIAGGWTGSTQASDVEYAKINSDGTLDPWVKTTPLPQARSGHKMAISNGYAYINGGVSPGSSSAVDTTIYAAIQTDGSLGEWQKAFTTFTNGREQHEMQIYNGYMYIFAGYSPVVNIKRQDVQYASLSVIARKAGYSKIIDLGTESAINNISYTGTLPNGIESVTYRLAGNNGVFGTSKSATVVGCANGALGRYVQFFVVLSNEESAVFPDTSTASVSELESLIVDYDPAGVPPERRLRHGAWFLNEQLQSFQVKDASCS